MPPELIPATETDRTSLILADITHLPGALFWRNNTGALRDRTGRLVRFGRKGSSDIIGCYWGIFTAIETKTPLGKQDDDQIKFQRLVERAFGVYGIAQTREDARAVLAIAKAKAERMGLC